MSPPIARHGSYLRPAIRGSFATITGWTDR
jgi:hypothetical protein